MSKVMHNCHVADVIADKNDGCDELSVLRRGGVAVKLSGDSTSFG